MEFSGKPLYYEDLSMAVKKGETDWVALLTYSVQQMHENGALTEMSKQWYNGIDLTREGVVCDLTVSPSGRAT